MYMLLEEEIDTAYFHPNEAGRPDQARMVM